MIDKKQNRYHRDKFSNWRAVLVIAALLLFWAVILAIGALVHDSNIWRATMIMGSPLVFVTFWLIVLKKRHSS